MFLASMIFFSCTSKNSGLIINKWRPISVSLHLDDSTKNELFTKTTIEFTKNGRYFINGPQTNDTGTYELTDKGSTLTVTSAITKKNIEMSVDTLTNNRLVFTTKADGNSTTVVPK